MAGTGKSINKKQQAYEFMLSQITQGKYGPGFRIVIDRVARELGSSSIPVREAIQQLEAEGFVQNIPYSGAVVQLMNDEEYKDTMVVLGILEGAATAFAAEWLTSADIEEMERINRAMRGDFEALDFERLGEYNFAFHAVINEKCGNALLLEKIRQTYQRLLQIRSSVYALAPQRIRQSIDEHALLIQLFKQKAPAREIEEIVRQHCLRTLKVVQEVRTRRIQP